MKKKIFTLLVGGLGFAALSAQTPFPMKIDTAWVCQNDLDAKISIETTSVVCWWY
jgi:hypothetical protein